MTSYCTRAHPAGPRAITEEEFVQFLADDHLCADCAGVTDSEHAARIVAGERQQTTKETPA